MITLTTRPPAGTAAPGSLAGSLFLVLAAATAGALVFLLLRFVTSMLFFQGVAGTAPAGGATR